MGGGKSGGSSSKSYDYFGTITAVIRAGPIDTIHSILVDGKSIWEGPINRTDGGISNPYDITPDDPKWLQPGGYIRLWWGEGTEAVDANLFDHPPYKRFARVTLHKFLFGRERQTAPNVEVIATAKARPDSSIISSTSVDDGCVNPFAVAAEILTSVHGTKLAAGRLDATSWQACHDAIAATSELRNLCYCAPILTGTKELKAFLNELMSMCDGWLRLNSAGKIEAGFYTADPGSLGSLTTLTENDFESPPQVEAGSWDSVPTGVNVRFADRDRKFKETNTFVPELRALLSAVEPRNEGVDRPHVTRAEQAILIASEWVKRNCQPKLTGSVTVRPEKAVHPSGQPLRPGDRFLIDVDPEPGGSGLAQLARVVERRFGPTGPVTIRWESEPNQPALPFQPTYTAPDPETLTVADITQAQVIPLPTVYTGGTAAVGILASRPDDMVIGCEVLYDSDDGAGVFTQIGQQDGFAVRCQLSSDYAADATGAIRCQILDTRDQHLALRDVGVTGAINAELLLIVFKTSSGRVSEDADGKANLEIFSVQSSAIVSGSTYDFTLGSRSLFNTKPRAWTAGDAVWIIPKSSLVPWTHAEFQGRAVDGDVLTLKLRAFNRFATYDGSMTARTVQFPAETVTYPVIEWTTPSGSSGSADGSGNFSPAATVTDKDGNMVRLTLFRTRVDTGVVVTIADSPFPPTGSKTLAELFTATGVSSAVNFPGQVGADTVYQLTIRAEDSNGLKTESNRTIFRGPTSGVSSTPPPPTFSPESGFRFPQRGSVSTVITVVSPADRIEWSYDYGFGASQSGSVVTSTGLTKTVFITANVRIWARASDGTNHSAWVFADYYRG